MPPVALPGVPVVNLFDYFYHAHAHDLAGEAPPETPADYFHWRRSANAMALIELENGVKPWTGTQWQRDLFPAEYRDDFVVCHDGVDTRRFDRHARTDRVVAGRRIPVDVRVVSFVASHLDQLRGFDRFMRFANAVMGLRNDVLCLVVGGTPVQRGLDVRFFAQDYKAHVLAEKRPHDPGRCWFLGSVPPPVVAEVLAASDLHVYPSRPYPVGRSLLEAMASGCVVLAWDSPPVREFITHHETGLLVPAVEPNDALWVAHAVLEDRDAYRPLGEAAAALVRERYSQDVTLPSLAGLFDRLPQRRG